MMYGIDYFINKIKEKYGVSEFTVLNYIGMTKPCTIKCELCGKIQTLQTARQFLREGRICLCDHNVENSPVKNVFDEKKFNEFAEKIKNKYPDEDLVVLEYTGHKEKAIIKCNKCGTEYIQTGGSFTDKRKKKVCHKCIPREDTREVGRKVDYLIKNNDKLIVITPYKKITDDLEFQCKNCEGIFKRKPQVFLKTQRCPYCDSHAVKRTKEIFQKELDMKFNGEYTIIGDYIDTLTPTLFRHNDCGFIFKSKPHNIVTKAPCPKCKKFNSKGEIAIKKILDSHNICYEQQKRYKEVNALSFDFYIPKFNLLIEFQGEQHFSPVKHFGGESKFQKQQKNDNMKRKFCQEKKINLLEIKYTDIDKIEDILSFLWFND